MSHLQAFADSLLAMPPACPPGLTAWNRSDPARRFAVYRNNVMVSLIDALADSFPVTQALVGEEFFRAMAGVFARAHPPRSPVMAHYGDGFAGFIEDFQPAASLPYLADVARLEMLRVRPAMPPMPSVPPERSPAVRPGTAATCASPASSCGPLRGMPRCRSGRASGDDIGSRWHGTGSRSRPGVAPDWRWRPTARRDGRLHPRLRRRRLCGRRHAAADRLRSGPACAGLLLRSARD
jgi:hypothetical protein